MRFFKRRTRSADRVAVRNTTPSRQREKPPPSAKNGARGSKDDSSVGSELPTVDQFEIAVPSKSFANSLNGGDQDYPMESRDDAHDNRSNTDISSITSVSYRAGYYYLRNIKSKKPPESKCNKASGCLPSCSCALCMPCSCSWLTCCCCQEAKSELAATAAAGPNNSIMDQHPTMMLREKAARKSPAGRRALAVHPGDTHHRHPQNHNDYGRRYDVGISPISPLSGDERLQPVVERNHSLFDELSEEEEMAQAQAAYGRRRQQHPSPPYQQQQQLVQKRKPNKTWLTRRAEYEPGHEYAAAAAVGREKTSRGRPKQRGRRGERFY